MTAPATTVGSGLQLFARYAFPPNERGYCGPPDHQELFGYVTTGTTDPGLRELAAAFSGPWPYLELLAGAAGIDDPFDARVVEAYWVGNDLLDRVSTTEFGRVMEDHHRPRAGSRWRFLAEGVPARSVCHHSFHVFGVYPWVGLLRETHRGEPLEILDRCRIRWGKVLATAGEQVVVESRPLTWDGRRLALGETVRETVQRGVGGNGILDDLAPGEWVSLHWSWVCDRLTGPQLAALQRYSARQLTITNDRVAHSGPGVELS